MGLPMAQLYRYILASWKRLTANVTITDGVTNRTKPSVYSRELEKNYYKWHCYC